jgi:hydroxyethylthiazole kinase-like uncharacterized protein yjeF
MPPTLALYDANAARTLDTRATDTLGGDGFELMRRAGRAAWHCVLRHWPQAQRLVVVCGPGNNGGDGYVLARLALEAGRNVRVVRLAEHSPRTESATARARRIPRTQRTHGNLRRCAAPGGPHRRCAVRPGLHARARKGRPGR